MKGLSFGSGWLVAILLSGCGDSNRGSEQSGDGGALDGSQRVDSGGNAGSGGAGVSGSGGGVASGGAGGGTGGAPGSGGAVIGADAGDASLDAGQSDAAPMDVAGGDAVAVADSRSDAGVGGDATFGDSGIDARVGDAKAPFAELTFFVDDRANKTYDATDGLAWKGSFSYDADSNTLAYDAAWGGPYVPLWDDGPAPGGHEPSGAVAGDNVWSVVVGLPPPGSALDLQYGAIRESVAGSDGVWIWTGSTGQITVDAGETGRIDVPGLVIGSHGTVELRLELDTAALSPSFAGLTPSTVAVKGSAWGWREVVLTDDGTAGDLAAGDGIYTFLLSTGLAKHEGLAHLGATIELMFVLDGVEYREGGDATKAGVSAWSDAASPGGGACATMTASCSPEALSASSASLGVVVGPS